jgi:hypothetical protein
MTRQAERTARVTGEAVRRGTRNTTQDEEDEGSMRGYTGGQAGEAAAGGQTMVPARESADEPAGELAGGAAGREGAMAEASAIRAAREAVEAARRGAQGGQSLMGGTSARVAETVVAAEVARDAEPTRGESQCSHEQSEDENTDGAYAMEVEGNDGWVREAAGTGERGDGEDISTQGSDAGRPHKKRRRKSIGKRHRRALKARNATQDEEELVRGIGN